MSNRRIVALFLVSVAAVNGFGAVGGTSSALTVSKTLRPALRTRSGPVMSIHSPVDLVSSLISVTADVSDDFDVNTLPAPIQNLLLSPVVLAVPIGLGMTVAGAIIAFLLWSMGAF